MINYIPPYLKPGDTIGIVAPAGKISKEQMQASFSIIENWGYKIELGKHLFSSDNQFAGTDKERASDLQYMLDSKHIKAILCARGGYGTIRLLPYLDFSNFKKNPCWIIGYSDITVLHSYLLKVLNICSLHATMPINFSYEKESSKSLNLLNAALQGQISEIAFQSNVLNRTGIAEGIITGGNLSMLYSMRGIDIDIDTDGKILFIEDLNEYLYHIDRMMMNIKLGGKLSGLKGLLIGGISDMNDNTVPFGKTAREIIAESVSDYNFPVAFDFPAGHQKSNLPIILGRKVKLSISETGSELKYF
ncbi:MAG: LD-carboxypeptidase [Bacteroidota bacterium]|nr:LD-carboxypeptidase [Bacteroidota bacterium]